ncbi:MAG: AMP-binding protein [Oscillospiraceae bacterium]|nr:AMP-binding protein [Oscillospiraceae bacterium]
MLEKYLPRAEFSSYEDFIANYKLNIPESFNFGFDIVDEWAQREPDKLALVWCDGSGNERSFTFSEISRLSARAANFFSGIGVSKGDVVMCVLRQRFEYWITAVALCKLGAVIIPANMQLTAKDIEYRANAAKIKAVVCCEDSYVISQMEQALPRCPTVTQKIITPGSREGWTCFTSEIAAMPDDFARPRNIKNTDPMLIYFTSGTTGMPKMALHDFTHPLGHIVTAKYWQQVRENKLHLSWSDSGWAKFGWGKIYGQWICGTVVFATDLDRFAPQKMLELLEKYKVTTFCAPPTMYRIMLAEGMDTYDLSSIEHLGNAGEPLSPDVFGHVKGILGLDMSEGFGQSESSVLIANFPWFAPRPGSMGKPAPLYGIDLINSDGNPCDDGEEGTIVIRNTNATGLFKGYYLDDELSAKAFAGGIYNTGDVAWRDHDGYYWFVGRDDDVIKCSGYRIGPFEVESALCEHEAVLECAVTAAPDPKRGQVVKATVVLNKGFAGSDELISELQAHVKKLTAPYKYPRIIEFTDELPKTISGKIKRAQLRRESAGE